MPKSTCYDHTIYKNIIYTIYIYSISYYIKYIMNKCIYIYIYMIDCTQIKLWSAIYTVSVSLVQVHFLYDAITEFKRYYKIYYKTEN